MTQLDDFVAQCQPSYFAAGIGEATEARTWDWTLAPFVDAGGTLIDFTVAGVTFDGKVLDKINGSTVVTLTVVGGVGSIRVSATSTVTAGTAGSGDMETKYPWYVAVLMTSPTRKVDLWGVENSTIVVKQAGS